MRAGLRFNDYVFGLHDSGAMDEACLLRIIDELPEGTTEIYFHLATERCEEIDRYTPEYQHVAELEAVTSPHVAEALVRLGVEPEGFLDL